MTYQETLDFLYGQLPVFENIGANAYKPGLERVLEMDAILGNPHSKFKTIHVAGTNGKGTISHTLASILQEKGMRVGLFTSPHLLDFNERIRVNGYPVEHEYVVEWTAKNYDKVKHLQPSFFELATMIGFCYFADQKVDIAVIEVGLGGRLDSTNIINPELCVITNISYDHMQFLGDTLAKIAGEKAGIMKKGVPCVIGECTDDSVRSVFEQTAEKTGVSKLTFASDYPQIVWVRQNKPIGSFESAMKKLMKEIYADAHDPNNSNSTKTINFLDNTRSHNVTFDQKEDKGLYVIVNGTTDNLYFDFSKTKEGFDIFLSDTPENIYETINNGAISCPLMGACQPKNTNTILAAVHQLNLLGYDIDDYTLKKGFMRVIKNTHLMGRWQTLSDMPHIICDTGHNEGCFQYLGKQLQNIIDKEGTVHIVFGMVRDKDISAVLKLLPKDGQYYFCNAPTQRSLPAAELASLAAQYGIKGRVYASVRTALRYAKSKDVTTFIGGSNFVVAEAMKALHFSF